MRLGSLPLLVVQRILRLADLRAEYPEYPEYPQRTVAGNVPSYAARYLKIL
jgi:hypothetical protein